MIYSKVKPNMNVFMGSVGYFSHVLPYTAEPVFNALPMDNWTTWNEDFLLLHRL